MYYEKLMELKIKKTNNLSGTVKIPGSKSHAIRGIFLQMLAEGEGQLTNLPDSEDIQNAQKTCQAIKNGDLQIPAGNSGLAARFALPLLEPQQKLVCGEQMQARPMQPLIKAIKELEEKHETEVDGKISQYLSALLIAQPLKPYDSIITVKNPNERPYINMTLAWIRDFGGEIQEQNNTFHIKGGQKYTAKSKDIPGDWSSAAVFIAANALIPGEIQIEGLTKDPLQADSILPELIENWPQEIDCSKCPDLLPILAVIATQKKLTRLKNATHSRIKESDRITAMAEALQKMGAKIEEHEDGLTIQKSELSGAEVDGKKDHRIIMALTLAGMLAEGQTTIKNAEGLAKTYPNFIESIRKIGANI